MVRSLAVVDLGLIDFAESLETQRRLAVRRAAGTTPDLLLLCEHPPVFTIGRAGGEDHVLAPAIERGVTIVSVERGGDITYHGPGQVVAYPILALSEGERDLHRYLRNLEEVVIRVVARFGVVATREPGLTGVWANGLKLCAIGVAVRRWVTFHGFALNINIDLQPFEWIVPCGLHGRRVTSMQQLCGEPVPATAVKQAIVEEFCSLFARQPWLTTLEGALSEKASALEE